MGRGSIRAAGILALVNAALMIGVLAVLNAADRAAAGETRRVLVLAAILGIGLSAFLVLFGLLAARALFRALGHAGGGGRIWTLAILSLIAAPIAMLAVARPAALMPVGEPGLAILALRVYLGFAALVFLAALLFAFACVGFGGRARFGLWIATGLLYVVASLGWLAAIGMIALAMIGGDAAGARVFAGQGTGGVVAGIGIAVGLLAGLAGLVCQGVGLILGAGRLAAR